MYHKLFCIKTVLVLHFHRQYRESIILNGNLWNTAEHLHFWTSRKKKNALQSNKQHTDKTMHNLMSWNILNTSHETKNAVSVKQYTHTKTYFASKRSLFSILPWTVSGFWKITYYIRSVYSSYKNCKKSNYSRNYLIMTSSLTSAHGQTRWHAACDYPK